MKFINALAFSATFVASFVAAAPFEKRDIVIETVVAEVIETVEVTTTVWVDPTPAAAAADAGARLYETPAQGAPAPPSNSPPASPPAPQTPAYTPPPPPPAYTPPPPAYTPPPPPPPAYTPPAQAQAPSPVPQPQPQPQPQQQAQSPAQQPPAQSNSNAPSAPASGAQVFDVQATYYNPGGAYGSCGQNIAEDAPVVALAASMMGSQGNGNPFCGRKIKIEYKGQQFDATIADKCPGCKGSNGIDLPEGFWKKVCPDADGVANLKWWFVS